MALLGDRTDSYYYMSGISQAAAVTGVVALLLEAELLLSPDKVECKSMAGARPTLNPDGALAFSLFSQGAGLVNAPQGLASPHYDCANPGLDVDADLAGTRHFGGRATQDANGDFHLLDADGFLWSDSFLWSDIRGSVDGFLWSDRLTEPMSINRWVRQE